MKFSHISTILVSLAIAISATAQSPLMADGAEFDFGLVPQNATLYHRVWVRCSGSDTVTLTELKTGCGCLIVSPERRQIVPGDSLMLSCYWQTRGSVGAQQVSAYLYTGDGQLPLELRLGGNVVTRDDSVASLQWRPLRLEFAAPAQSRKEYSEQAFVLTNMTEKALSVAIVEQVLGLEVSLPDSVGKGQEARGRVGIAETYRTEDFESSFTLELTGNLGETFRVSIPVVSGDFSFRPVFTTTR